MVTPAAAHKHVRLMAIVTALTLSFLLYKVFKARRARGHCCCVLNPTKDSALLGSKVPKSDGKVSVV